MYFEIKDFESAIQHLQQAAEIFDSYRMWDELARAYSYLGYAYQAAGDAERAIQTYADHIAMCRRTGDIGSAAGTMANLSLLLYAVGDREQAIRFGEQACDVLERVGSPHASGYCHVDEQ
jgi:tetratricopeptide (TPR) repeat protein